MELAQAEKESYRHTKLKGERDFKHQSTFMGGPELAQPLLFGA